MGLLLYICIYIYDELKAKDLPALDKGRTLRVIKIWGEDNARASVKVFISRKCSSSSCLLHVASSAAYELDTHVYHTMRRLFARDCRKICFVRLNFISVYIYSVLYILYAHVWYYSCCLWLCARAIHKLLFFNPLYVDCNAHTIV